MALISADWYNWEQLLQTDASKAHSQGLEATCSAFKAIHKSGDIELIVRSESLTVARERELYGKDDASVVSSLDSAINDFVVMTSALAVVQQPEKYQSAAATYHSKKKVQGIPIDGFHEAINGHITRLGNRVRAVGISMPEKNILRQRQINMRAAKELYTKLQRKALDSQ